MPNHVSNELTVDGATKEVNRFLKHMGKGFDFEKIIPMPDALSQTRNPNWYDWSMENWDTKWNAYDVKRDVGTYGEASGKYVTYRFNTAWSPPEKIVEKLREDWPELEIYGGYIGENHEYCDSF